MKPVVRLLTAAMILAAAIPPVAFAQPEFTGMFRSLDVGAAAQDIATADLNGDGMPDLVLVHTGANPTQRDSVLSVWLGQAGGGFAHHADYPTREAPASVDLLDVTGDGKLDAIVPCWAARCVAIFPGKGNGAFLPRRDVKAGLHPYRIALADFDRDGITDLAVVNSGTGPKPKKPEGLAALVVEEVADSSSVTFHRGLKGGTFAKPQAITVGEYPNSTVAADLNGDGAPDLITSARGSQTLAILWGGPKGLQPGPEVKLGYAPTDLASADLNGDGLADVVASVTESEPPKEKNGYVVQLGGKGNLPAPVEVLPEDFAPGRIELADVNGDGRADMVALYEGGLASLLGNGDGTFQSPVHMRIQTGSALALANLNGDASADVICSNTRGRSLALLAGAGDGRFGTPAEVAMGMAPTSVVAADLNADGNPDLIAANGATNTISVALGTGKGAFAERRPIEVGEGASTIRPADVDGDGKLDLVVMKVRGKASEISLLRGRGDGTFEPRADLATGVDPATILLVDLNADGKLDLVVPKAGTDEIAIYPAKGKGSFGAVIRVPLGHTPTSLAAGDLNADGKVDLVAADGQRSFVSVLMGQGEFTLKPSPSFRTRILPGPLAIADMDGDGKPDLVIGPKNMGIVGAILSGMGDGTFGKRIDITTTPGAETLTVTDLNGDGTMDLAMTSAMSNTVSAMLGKGDGTFGPRIDMGAGLDPASLAVADLNGDGTPDFAVANRESQNVSLHWSRIAGR
jgi:hypothetical protein